MTTIPDHLQPGFEAVIGSYCFEPDEILRFANKFDTQLFHTDPAAAKQSLFGGLCASGWHTASVWMKLHRAFASKRAAELEKQGIQPPEYGPSPGFNDLSWLKPVYAGDTITYTNRNKSIRQSNSRPGWWVMEVVHEGLNQDAVMVISFTSFVLVFLPEG